MLAVEVGGIHHVIVQQQQFAHAAANKHESGIGPQPPGTGNAYADLTQALQVFLAEVAGKAVAQHVVHGVRLRFLPGLPSP